MDPPRPGDTIGDRYTLEREIGRGGMAIVFSAKDHRHERTVAVKLLEPTLTGPLGPDRFEREIRVAANLSHPHIVPVHDSGEHAGRLYYVMPRVEGVTLKSALEERGRFSLEDTQAVTRDVGEALAYAHERGVVHRDIKPSNIMLASGHAVVTDFGVAKALDDAKAGLTSSSTALGTPGYMAPEQATGDSEVGPSADIYGLACVAYEMLTGEPPFKAASAHVRLARQLMGDPPSASDRRPELPRGAVDAIRRAMSLAPENRFETVTGFVAALGVRHDAATTRWSRLPRLRRPESSGRRLMGARAIAGVALTVVLAGVAYGAVRMIRAPAPGSWPGGRPPSVVVLPMETVRSTEASRRLAATVSERINSELDHWEGIRIVPGVSLSGVLFDHGIDGGTAARLEDAAGVARDLGVAALLTISAEIRDDSARVEATIFDPAERLFMRSPRQVGRTIQAADDATATAALAEPIIRRVLGLAERPFESLADQRRRTRNPEALIRADEGREYLERWQLDDAERSFRAAIDLDPSFAFAHYRLAQTLYWYGAADPLRRIDVAEEVARASSSAVRRAGDLPPADEAHIRAFHSFQEGDYAAARRQYDAILRQDSTDVYAWLMLGSVEYVDPWLTDDGPSATPRGSWNRALAAFLEAVRLHPSFELGYGHVFDIYEAVVRTLNRDREGCRGFETPRGVNLPPWETATPESTRLFCIVALDSIAWVAREDLASLDREAMRAGAAELFQEAAGRLVRWSLYAPTLPKPREELARLTLIERMRYEVAPPELLDSLAAVALGHYSEAVSLKPDTVPGDLFRLANLSLGVGRFDDALALAETGIRLVHEDADPDAPVPPEAVNALLATGRVTRALDLLAPARFRRFVPDSLTGEFVAYGGAETHLLRVRVLAGAMAGGSVLRTELGRIGRVWDGPGYDDRARAILRRNITPELAPALVFDAEALDLWGEVPGLEDPVWQAILALSRADDDAIDRVERAMSAETRMNDMVAAFVRGALALRVDFPDHAYRMLSRIDSIPLQLDRFDARWGMLASSHLLRGDAKAALGEPQTAREHYERYLESVSHDDSLTALHRAHASERLRRLGR